MVHEARLEQTDWGVEPKTDGWFVVNVRDAAWGTSDDFGAVCITEGEGVPFSQLGAGLHVLRPGQPNGLYHAESNQEDFLVLSGECLLLIEGKERRLKAWDFVHCPPNTEHIFVGAGTGPCVIFMTGARDPNRTIVYPRSELALRHGAGVANETDSPREAYAPFEEWRPGRPALWDELPWA